MKFTRARILLSWLGLFEEAEIGYDSEEQTVGVQIPGLLKENGEPNNKGNVIVALKKRESDELMNELWIGKRVESPAEMVRRTMEWEDGVYSFKVSSDSGSRTVKVPEDQWRGFLLTLEKKLADAGDLLQAATDIKDSMTVPEPFDAK